MMRNMGSNGESHGHGFIAATSMNSAGKVIEPAAREMVTRPSSSGCRSTSSVVRFERGALELGQLVEKEDAVVRDAHLAGCGIR